MVIAAAYVERIVGKNMRKKMESSLNPSILAASMISCGKDLEACRNIIIINGVEMDGSINAAMVFTMPNVENIRNMGIITAAKGIIIAVSKTVNTASLPLS